jgi:hypothetical protein
MKPAVQIEMREVDGDGMFSKRGEIVIDELSGKPEFASKKVHITGRIDPFEGKNIDIDVTGEGINLWEFSASFRPLFGGVPSEMFPTGTAGCRARFEGPLEKISIGGNLILSKGKLASIKLDFGDVTFHYADNVLEINEGTVNCYGGKIDLSAELLLAEGPAYRFYIDFEKLDVNTYLEDIQLYFQEAIGDFQGHFEGYGEIDNPYSFIARGGFVSGGGTYLSPFHKELPESPERLTYDALRVEFEVAKGIIAINHLLLDSQDLGAIATGTLNSQRSLEMKGQMKFPVDLAYKIPEVKKWAHILPKTKEKEVVMDFTLEGDIMDPEFKTKLPKNIFEGFLTGEYDFIGEIDNFVGKAFD